MSIAVHLSDAIDKFLEYQSVRKGRTRTTINTYRSTLRQFLTYAGDISIADLKVELIDAYAETLSNFKPKTLRNKLTPIRSLVSYLYAKDKITLRKESIDLPTVNEIEANFLDASELQQMIDACRNVKERALILILVRSGLRVSEFINTRTEDVYDRSLIVRRSKGGKPRVTFITEDAELAIKALHDMFDEEQYWLFPSESGLRVSRQYICKVIHQIAKRAGIKKKVSPHTMRHTFATNLLMNGARVEDVQPMMGHKSIRTTLIYMHFTNAYLKERYDEFMNKAPFKY